ncbi:toll/interleukin-1 receptor domain-containing protein [Luteolibacter sp. SL250]|uniref:toll/interleukin-1 receptor domain-containing protein n=1 Tax=Luteolibacter sp. SL250 TaxID=2995170 RepID=UPI00226E8460|nr:toll/interleukin-1 receptor domain-containing protein [Luteolibacter sp. SL250]WAC20365.1 toll/interleukin-1 receptor domain-containing protein [Luteolibacter sp. SL250]
MALAVALEARGKSCWIAPRNIGAGTNYPHEIVEGIKRCPEFVIVLSNAAVRSDHILRELEMAVNQRKKIIPIRLSGVELGNSVSYLLASVQWIEVREDEWKNAPGRVADQILGGAGSRIAYEPAKARTGEVWIGAAAAGLVALAAAAGAWKAGWFVPRQSETPAAAESSGRQETPEISPSGLADRQDPEGKPPGEIEVGQRQQDPPGGRNSAVAVIPPKPLPEPMANSEPVAFPEGVWRCTGKAAFEIEWGMTFTRHGDELRVSGAKALVGGKPATRGERQTTLELRGRLDGTSWEGRYVETSKKVSEGDFQIRFSEDLRSFDGKIFTPDRRASSKFEGIKR